MKSMRVMFALSSLLLAGLAGCGSDTSPPTAGSVTADETGVVQDSTADATDESSSASGDSDGTTGDDSQKVEITAEIASWEETQKYIAKQKGKVVVLDAWSTSCLPCIKELPNLVALQKKYPKRVVCVTLNLDYYGAKNMPPEASKEAVMKVLRQVNADMHNIISSTVDEEFYESVDLGSIPAVFVYAPDGTLKKRFDNDLAEYGDEGFGYEKHIVPLVEELLAAE